MLTLNYKSHVFTLMPTDPSVAHTGLNLYCGKTWLLKIDFTFSPSTPLSEWLDRAVELITLVYPNVPC